jgi:CRP-like cAMP-binding protein
MAKNSGATGPYRNAILKRLSPEVLRKLPLQPVEFPLRKVLHEPNEEIEYAYFPEAGVFSVVSVMKDGSSIEIGTIGREGMACSVLLLKVNTVPYRNFVQVAGDGYRVGASQLTAAAEASEPLRDVILQYEAVFRTQTMQGMACNGLHNIQQRCCRWLLMTRDRVDSDDLKLTHEFLALMLGVRRTSVTEVLAPLQEMELVKSNHGTITILNRKALEARVCECYWIMVQREREA